MDQSVETLLLKYSFSSQIKKVCGKTAKQAMPGGGRSPLLWFISWPMLLSEVLKGCFLSLPLMKKAASQTLLQWPWTWSNCWQGAEPELPMSALRRCRRGGWKAALLLLRWGLMKREVPALVVSGTPTFVQGSASISLCHASLGRSKTVHLSPEGTCQNQRLSRTENCGRRCHIKAHKAKNNSFFGTELVQPLGNSPLNNKRTTKIECLLIDWVPCASYASQSFVGIQLCGHAI